MLLYVLSFLGGILFVLTVLTIAIIYSGINSLNKAYRDGWDMPYE
jgi:preprotein translocase subunit Sec63